MMSISVFYAAFESAYEWARLMFQKCAARWKYWKPETPDALRRMAEANHRD